MSGGQPPPDAGLVQRFTARFSGFTKAFGQFAAARSDDRGKLQGKSWTVSGSIKPEHIDAHLLGSGAGLGVIMLRDDETCVFGAIDLDDNKMDHVAAAKAIRAKKLPLVLCRSKSGGGHFYCFTTEPVSAALMRMRLSEWAALLGFAATTEIFPKQTTRYNDSDTGSWINLPYYNAHDTERYAYSHKGERLDLAGFLSLADEKALSKEGLQAATFINNDASKLFPEGPPCLQMLEAKGGFAQGTKRDGMFNVGVYLQKQNKDTWERQLPIYNQTMAQLQTDEVADLAKSLKKRSDREKGDTYSYKCSQPPINAYCNRALCLTRKHGIGRSADSQVTIESITRYQSSFGDDAFWVVQLQGQRVQLTTAELYHVDKFNVACLSQSNVVPLISVTPSKWRAYLNELIARADVVPIPDDATPSGQVWAHIEAFCTQTVQALRKEELWQGKIYIEGGRVYFRSRDVFFYLDSKRMRYQSQMWVWNILRERGGQKEFWNIRKQGGVNVWSLPEFDPVPMPTDAPEEPVQQQPRAVKQAATAAQEEF